MLGLAGNLTRPIFPFHPVHSVSSSVMQMWLRNNVRIGEASWEDSSGQGNHVTQGTSADQATIVKGGYHFADGEEDHYDFTSPIAIASGEGLSIFLVIDIDNYDSQNTIFGIGATTEFLEFQTAARIRVRVDAATDVIDYGAGAFAAGSKMLISIFRKSGGTGEFTLHKNGVALTGTATSGNTNVPGAIDFSVLGTRNADRFFYGKIYEVMVYDGGDLTTGEVTNIHNYLLNKHDL